MFLSRSLIIFLSLLFTDAADASNKCTVFYRYTNTGLKVHRKVRKAMQGLGYTFTNVRDASQYHFKYYVLVNRTPRTSEAEAYLELFRKKEFTPTGFVALDYQYRNWIEEWIKTLRVGGRLSRQAAQSFPACPSP